jgi:Protein of unknown function (DUF992)
VAAIALAAMTGASATRAEQNPGVKAGFLTCNVDSGWGFVFGSSRSLKCTYAPQANVEEHYVGSVTKFGVDIGYLNSAVIVWAVLAPGGDAGEGALGGNYAGVTGSATVGGGLGANVLVGGSSKAITLQPVSIEGNTGLNVAGGIEALTLAAQK